MRAMRWLAAGTPLVAHEIPRPEPGAGEIRIAVRACAVCRTDLHIADGDLTPPRAPLTPGHEIVGRVDALGPGVDGPPAGTRVGVGWLGGTCGVCPSCRAGRENLCDRPVFTGYDVHGGYADYAIARADFCFPIPEAYGDAEAAPLLCAGLIGHRTLRMAGDAEHLGVYGFGAAAHIVAQVARYEGRKLYAFTRPGDAEGQKFARELGAVWAGSSASTPSHPLDAALIFAPAGELVPLALAAVRKGGTVVCGGIHMSDIPTFPYRLLWEERCLRSVANLTRQDAREFLELAPRIPVRTTTQRFPLAEANTALDQLRAGRLRGAAVLVPTEE